MPQNAFIIRCAPSKISRVEELVLKEDLIVIGWSNIQDLLLDDKLSRDDFKRLLIQEYSDYNENPYSLGQAVGYLWRFIREMQEGDYVLVPIPRAFYIGEITGEAYYFESGLKDDTAIRRNVKWLNNKKPILRDYCDSGLISRLKYQGTCVGAGDLIPSINTALELAANNKAVSFKDQAQDKLREQLISVLSSKSTNLTPKKFEELVRQLLTALGADTSKLPSNRIYKNNIADVDVIADFINLGIRIYVQVKYHNNETDIHAVKQIIEALRQEDADSIQPKIGWVVSSAKFSEEAINLADMNGIRHIDVNELSDMIISIGLDKFNI